MSAMSTREGTYDFLDVRNFSNVFAGAVSSLYLNRKVEQTCDSLAAYVKTFDPIANASVDMAERIRSSELVEGVFVDADDLAIDALEQGAKGLEELLPRLVRRKDAVDRDRELREHHRDVLHTSFDDAISSLSAVIEGVRDLRTAIINHDMDVEPEPAELFDSAEGLMRSLRA